MQFITGQEYVIDVVCRDGKCKVVLRVFYPFFKILAIDYKYLEKH